MESRIGKYQVQNELGRGGCGRVYHAYDPAVGRPVAIKVLDSEGDPDMLARFRAEAGTTGKLQHKNIVTVFDCGEQGGSPYLVMEYLEGETLQALFRSKRVLSLLDKMRIICQTAEGLYYAHQSGVIHRDVKPANLMLLPNGVVKIMDFGIARLVDTDPCRRTGSGDLIGTTSYMSPEQFRGTDADVLSDIFAFGLICYELLSGVHPFQAPDVSAMIYRIMSVDPVPLREVFPECPKMLDQLVHHTLEKDRNQRYASLDDLLIDVEPIMLDLRREQSAGLMVEVKGLIAKGDLAKGQVLLKQALELDPLNREARNVKDALQEQRHRQLIEANIRSLEQDGSSKLAKRSFSEALLCFESALRLSPTDPRLKALVEDARGNLQANREACKLLSEAKGEAQREQLTKARTFVLQALAADPGHPEAPPLLLHLEAELERIERATRLASGLEESDRLLQNGEFEEALEALRVLEAAHQGSPQITDLRNRVQVRQKEDLRRKQAVQLEEDLFRARQLKSAGELAGASEILNSLQSSFPRILAISDLSKLVKEEIAAEQRASQVANLLDAGRDLIWSKRPAEAVTALEKGLKSFPDDAGLKRLLGAAQALNIDDLRRQQLADIAQNARGLRQQNRLDEALEVLRNDMNTNGTDTILSDMCRVATLEKEDHRSLEQLQQYCSTAANQLDSGAVAQALTMLREAQRAYPGEPSIELLLERAEQQLGRQNEQETVDFIMRSSAQREMSGDLTGALKQVKEGLRQLPESRDLQTAAIALQAKVQSSERERRINNLAIDIRRTMESGDWSQATTMAAAASREYPEQIVFDDLINQLQVNKHTAEAEKAISGVREAFKTGNLESAVIQLAQLEPKYGNDEIWKAEKRKIENYHKLLERFKQAEELRGNGAFKEAEAILLQLTAEDPSYEKAFDSLKSVTEALLRSHPEEVVLSGRLKAHKLADGEDLSGPEKFSMNLAEQFPKDAAHLPRKKNRLQITPVEEAGRVRKRVQFAEPFLADHDPAALLFCRKCKGTPPEGARFCDKCGAPVV